VFDQNDWNELKKKKKQEKEKQTDKAQEFLARTAVDMEYLTGNEQWDKYLTYLQGILNKAQSAKMDLEDQLLSPELVNHEHIIKIKAQIARYQERVDVLMFVMTFPKDIIEHGKVANKKLKL